MVEEAGLETDGMAETTSQLQAKLKALTDGKVDIMVDANNFKNTTQILREMAAEWENLTDVEQAAALELLGGKRQANTLAAILTNFDIVEDAIESSSNSAGSALEENAKVLDSIQGRINQFNNALQTMWNNALDSDLIKSIVSFGTELIKIVDDVGLLNSALIALAARKGFGALFESLKDDGVTIKSVWNLINQLTFATRQQQIADAAAAGTTLSRMNAEKLLNLSIVKRFATEQIDAAVKKANLARDVALVAAKEALALAEEQYAEGLIDDIALQTAKNAVDAASVPITASQIGVAGILGATFKGLAVSIWGAVKAISAFLFTNPVGWLILLTGAVVASVAAWNKWGPTTENLRKKLEDLKSELQDIKSELDSVNSELKTTQDRMAELLAMDSLSFTEQEELDNLRKTNDELQRKIDLLELENKQKNKEVAKKFVETRESDEGNSTGYTSSGKKTWVDRIGGGSDMKPKSISGKEYLEQQLEEYKKNQDEIARLEQAIIDAGGEDTKEGKKLLKKKNKYEKRNEGIDKTFIDKFAEWDKDAGDLEYFTGDDLEDWQIETNKWLDFINNTKDKFAIAAGGTNAKSNAIKRIFNKDENDAISESINDYVEALKKGDTSAKISIENIINNNKDLVADIEASGLSVNDAVDYFTSFASSANYATIEGKVKEIEEATKRLNVAFRSLDTSSVDSVKQALTDKGWVDTEGNLISDVIAEYFGGENGGISEKTRVEIERLVQQIYDGKISVENALKQFGYFGIESTLDIYVAEVQTNFKDVFVDLEEADGLIDTFEEFGEAIGSAAKALDTFNQAQKEMSHSGHVSIETALQLMEYTDDYGSILEVVDGKLRLVDGAEEELINQRIKAIQVSAEASLTDATNAYNKAVLAVQEYNAAMTSDLSAQVVSSAWEKVLAAGAGLWEGIKSLITEESWTEAYNRGYNTTLSNITGYETEYSDSGYQALVDAQNEAEQVVKEAQDRVNLANQLTADTLESVYNSDIADGSGKTNAEEVISKALEKLQKKYERQISNLDNQQTYLENEIEALEAKGEGVSRKYYEEQIDREEKKLDLYKQERTELLALLNSTAEGSDQWWEVSDAIWETEHAIQESTLQMIEFRKSIVELYQTAFDDIADAYGNKDSLFDDRKAYIEGYAELLELQNELVPVNAYKELIALEEQDKANNIAMLESLQTQYNRFINSAEYKEGSKDALQAAIDMQAEMRATEKAIQDNDIALAQFNEDLENLYIEGWDKVVEAFENRDAFYEHQQSFADAYVGRLETMNINVPDEVYDKMIEIQKIRNQNTQEELKWAYEELEILKKSVGENDPKYLEKLKEVSELELKRYEGESQLLEYEQQIIENRFDRFDQVIDRIDHSINELKNISGLVSDEDVAFEDGSWTSEGITQLGLAYHQMEINKQITEEYAAEIDELTKLYDEGEISEKTYTERLQELQDGQWGAINAYKDAEDSIISLNEARIDMIEDGINKEIEAYQELIDLKKEELDAERD